MQNINQFVELEKMWIGLHSSIAWNDIENMNLAVILIHLKVQIVSQNRKCYRNGTTVNSHDQTSRSTLLICPFWMIRMWRSTSQSTFSYRKRLKDSWIIIQYEWIYLYIASIINKSNFILKQIENVFPLNLDILISSLLIIQCVFKK